MADDATKTEDRSEGQDKTEDPKAATKTDSHESDEDLQKAFQGDKECPECGEPVEDVRMTCPNCGYEYSKDDYTDEEAGNEFRAGAALDESGEEKEGVTGDAEVDAEDGNSGEASSDATSGSSDEDEDEESSEDTSDDTSSDTSGDDEQ